MSYNLGRETSKTARVRSLFGAALVLACAFVTVTPATAQTVTPPTTPAAITPPPGNSPFLVGHAFGTQGYVCLPPSTPGGNPWAVNPARPEATLFTDVSGQPFQIITHFLSPDANPQSECPQPATAWGQRDVAEFARHQQGMGTKGGIDRRRLGSQLPEYWRDSLPLIAVNPEPKGANGWSATGHNYLHPTP